MPHRKTPPHLAGKRIVVVVNPQSAQQKWRRSPKFRAYLQARFPGRIYDHFAGKADMIETVARLAAENDVVIGLGGTEPCRTSCRASSSPAGRPTF